MFMVVRAKDVETSEAFKSCDPTHKKELYEIVSNYDGFFRNQVGFLQSVRSNMRFTCSKMLLYPTLVCTGC